MSMKDHIISIRGSRGIKFCYALPSSEDYNEFPTEQNPSCRDMTFSKDGNIFAWSNNQTMNVVKGKNYESAFTVDDSRINFLQFSPKGTYLSTWSPYITKQNPQESCNLHIWNVNSGQCVKSVIQKKQSGWNPQWSDDEFLCARSVSNEVHFYENANFDNIAKKIFLQKVAYFSLSPGEAPYHIACYVPGLKGQPSFVRLFKYPNFEGANAVIAQKSFFKAERTDFYWNKTGKDCIFLTSVDVDKSGMSYYGELNLYYCSVKGDTAKIKLNKDGPVYSLQWSPNSIEFCVVYGYMPAKAIIFNLKCEPVFEFDAAPRNQVNYSPIGDRLALSGFGNLQGLIEVWDLKAKKNICKFTANDSTYIQWSYDGEFILTATTSPRLRIGNGYRIWHYTGSLQFELFCPTNDEIYDIRWKPVQDETFKVKPTIYSPVPGIKSAQPTASTQVYRPPGAQGKQSSFKLHDDIAKSQNNDTTKGALSKNRKRNLARKAKKESEKSDEPSEKSVSAPIKTKAPSIPEVSMTGDPEKDKKIKNILKKLTRIENLKISQAEGKTLELNQIVFINTSSELERELKQLQIS